MWTFVISVSLHLRHVSQVIADLVALDDPFYLRLYAESHGHLAPREAVSETDAVIEAVDEAASETTDEAADGVDTFTDAQSMVRAMGAEPQVLVANTRPQRTQPVVRPPAAVQRISNAVGAQQPAAVSAPADFSGYSYSKLKRLAQVCRG